jgi:hypothetical protein
MADLVGAYWGGLAQPINVVTGLAFGSIGSVATSSGLVSSRAVTLPTGSVGDIRFIAIDQVLTNTPTTPTGWTLLASVANAPSQIYFWLYYRIKQGGDSDSVTVSWPGNVVCGLVGFTFSGENASPIGPNSTDNAANQNTTTVDPPSITTAANDSWVVTVGNQNGGGASSGWDATQSGYTVDGRSFGPSGQYGNFIVCHYLKSVAGSTNPPQIVGPATTGRACVAFELKKA